MKLLIAGLFGCLLLAVLWVDPAQAQTTQSSFKIFDNGTENVIHGSNIKLDSGSARNHVLSSSSVGWNDGGVNGSDNLIMGHIAANRLLVGDGNLLFGYGAGHWANTSDYNVFLGFRAGFYFSKGDANIFIGQNAGRSSANHPESGDFNVFIGQGAGRNIVGGSSNVSLGRASMLNVSTGSDNVSIGVDAGRSIGSANNNVFLGAKAGNGLTVKANSSPENSSNNSFIGFQAGRNILEGRQNIFIGENAGYADVPTKSAINHRLFIGRIGDETFSLADAAVTSPLIFGNMESRASGGVGIMTTDLDGYQLAVAGAIRATEVKIELLAANGHSWPDYVFAPDYELMPLPELKAYIEAHDHLPDVPAAAEVEQNGFSLGETSITLLRKVEELYLHAIQAKKERDVALQENAQLKARLAALEAQMAEVKALLQASSFQDTAKQE